MGNNLNVNRLLLERIYYSYHYFESRVTILSSLTLYNLPRVCFNITSDYDELSNLLSPTINKLRQIELIISLKCQRRRQDAEITKSDRLSLVGCCSNKSLSLLIVVNQKFFRGIDTAQPSVTYIRASNRLTVTHICQPARLQFILFDYFHLH